MWVNRWSGSGLLGLRLRGVLLMLLLHLKEFSCWLGRGHLRNEFHHGRRIGL